MSKSHVVKILIVDDHALFVEALRLALEGVESDTQRIITTETSANAALTLLNGSAHFDLILIDIDMPEMNGFDFINALQAMAVTSTVVVVSAGYENEIAEKAEQLGIAGYISKNEPLSQLSTKIDFVLDGERLISELNVEQLTNAPENSDNQAHFSERQIHIIRLIAEGKSNKKIARLLHIELNTVKYHVKSIFLKLGVNNRTWCAREARKKGVFIE
ncbi:MAG: response regulator transcription factor [Arenicellales bacterium]